MSRDVRGVTAPLPASESARKFTWAWRSLLGKSGSRNTWRISEAIGAKSRVGATTTNYLYDDLNPVQEIRGGVPIANLLGGLGVDEIFTRTDASGTANFLTDALGSTLALADSTGTIQTQYTYEPFGNTIASGQANANPYQYTGRENDATGLYFHRARYYNPSFQRFISGDPIGFNGGINLYAYVGDDPIDFADPLGLGKKPPRRPKPGKPRPPCPPTPPTPPPPNPPQSPTPPPAPSKPRRRGLTPRTIPFASAGQARSLPYLRLFLRQKIVGRVYALGGRFPG